jgi:hypothetical protein
LPELERIDKEEFVLDFAERDRLLEEADSRIDGVRKTIETENYTKIIIRERIKKECWDSMKVVGQSVKSFNLDPLTGSIMEVLNYPLRIRTEDEESAIGKIKLLRKTEMLVDKELNPKLEEEVTENDALGDEDGGVVNEGKAVEKQDDLKETIADLLFKEFDLKTNERRRMQSLLLQEYVHELRMIFNDSFLNLAKMKREGITKIEEKNERIKTIMEELVINEHILHPELDDDEVPDRIVEVFDSEISCQKV